MSKTERLEKLEVDLLEARAKASTKPGRYRDLARVIRSLGPHREDDAQALERIAEEDTRNLAKLDAIIESIQKMQKG